VHHDSHVSPEEMKRFVANELSAPEAQELVTHLLTGCPGCLALARREGALEPGPGRAADGFEAILRRLETKLRGVQRDVDAQLRRGAAQWARLAPLSPAQRLTLLRNDRSLCHWGLLRNALDACLQAGKMNPVEAVDIASFALAIAESLDTRLYPPGNLNDFRSRALTALANAKRAAADFQGSERDFAAARKAMEQGTGDPYERANVICHEALLLRDLGEFEAAVDLLDEAFRLYRRVNDTHLCGRVLVQQASSIGFVDPLKGVELARRGLEMLDPKSGDKHLELSARNTLVHFLNDAGFAEEARVMQEAMRPLYAQFPGVAVQSRMAWLDGLIARNLGDFPTAEKKLRELREVFSRHDFDLELALVSLDLAELLLWSRRSAEAALLLRETFPVLVAWGLEKDLLALWLALADHLQAGTDEATLLMREAAATLRRGWNRRRAP
jgi:tetratricopeptide (TPR) repeat protein